MDNNTIVSVELKRIDLCDLLLACVSSKQCANDAGTKWVKLHDKLERQLADLDQGKDPLKEAKKDAECWKQSFDSALEQAQGFSDKCKELQKELDATKNELATTKEDAADWEKFYHAQKQNTQKIIDDANNKRSELATTKNELEAAKAQILELKAKLYDYMMASANTNN